VSSRAARAKQRNPISKKKKKYKKNKKTKNKKQKTNKQKQTKKQTNVTIRKVFGFFPLNFGSTSEPLKSLPPKFRWCFPGPVSQNMTDEGFAPTHLV
jgi:hypothetical protein